MHLPVYGVAPRATFVGCDNEEDLMTVPRLALATFEEAFCRAWATDAHFVLYAPSGNDDDGAPFPRLNKPVLSKVRELGTEVVAHSIALDWDTPLHEPWARSRTTFDDFLVAFEKAATVQPLLASPNALYTTRAGVRLVYILDTPIPVDKIEAKIRFLVYQCRAAGFMVDELADWTRLFRLPMVVRDGETTFDDHKHFQILTDTNARLPISQVGDAVKNDRPSVYGQIREFTDPQPTPEDAHALLYEMSEGKQKMTSWLKEARRRLRGRECWDVIFEHKPIADVGARDTTIHALVGQVTSLLYSVDRTTAEHIYALFLPAVEQLEGDAQTPDWSVVLWSAVGRLWVKEEAKEAAAKQDKREEFVKRKKSVHEVVNGMLSWTNHEGLYQDDDDARIWAEGRFIVSSGTNYYLIQPDGTYRAQPYSPSQLISAIRKHIPDLIPTRVQGEDGAWREVSLPTILNRHVTVVSEIEYQPGIETGFIRNIDTPSATLVLPCYSLNKRLSPTFDVDVDEWLKAMFGNQYESACRWIAWALAFDEGDICALSIVGSPGAGKKLLVQGLAETLAVPDLATDKDLVGTHQYGLLKSPFLSVNEGWTTGFGGKHAADRFREIVSGDYITVERKYKDPVRIKASMRVVFTANNLDVIRMLADKRDLTEADREALAVRLLHFDVGQRASNWLRLKGGMAHTSSVGRRWIAPPAGGESDFIVAKHFLWLYQNRHQYRRDERLLVEGAGAKDLMFEMQTQVGSSPLVIETILKMLSFQGTIEGMVVREKRDLYVSSQAILDHFRVHLSQASGSRLTIHQIASVLQGLVLEYPDAPYFIEGMTNKGKRRWWHIDTHKILRAAERHGIQSEKLVRMCEEDIMRGKRVQVEHEEGATR